MKYSFYLLFLALSMSSCTSLTPFTDSLQEQYDWTTDELHRIQFYNSDPIVLSRHLGTGTKEIIRGDIKIIDGREVEVISIPRRTKGILEFRPDDDRLAIRFEEGGNDERYLMFGPNPKYNQRYMLLASEWNRSSGKVTYEGMTYDAISGSHLASLLVNLKKIENKEVKSRRAGGVKVND